MSEFPRARILVVGDAGTGKSSLVHLLCSGGQHVLSYSQSTCGCNVEVMLYEYAHPGAPVSKTYCIEFWDVGGREAYAHALSRPLYYTGLNGIMLVCDLSNVKSVKNLAKWAAELVAADKIKKGKIAFGARGECLSVSRVCRL